jgi:hypothetical protein
MKYGIIIWGNSPNSILIFALQKRNVRIMADAGAPCACISSLTNFVIDNLEYFLTNLAVHNVNTRNRDHLHRPIANLSCFQKVHTFLATKYSSLPLNLKIFMNKRAEFKVTLVGT